MYALKDPVGEVGVARRGRRVRRRGARLPARAARAAALELGGARRLVELERGERGGLVAVKISRVPFPACDLRALQKKTLKTSLLF